MMQKSFFFTFIETKLYAVEGKIVSNKIFNAL